MADFEHPDPRKHPGVIREKKNVVTLIAGILETQGMTREEAEREAAARIEASGERSARPRFQTAAG
jgi:hypothetical protein